MEIHTRRNERVHDQENIYNARGKGAAVLPGKRMGLGVRGALGDVNTNIQAQRDVMGKVANATAEFEKKANLNRGPLKSTYGHVQSKIDTGLAAKPAPARPTLRREESTAALSKAASRSRAGLKDTTNRALKTTSSSSLLAKKTTQDVKKPVKGPSAKDTQKEKAKENKENKLSIKDPADSLGRLKLAEPTNKQTVLIKNLCSPLVRLPHDIEDIDAADVNSPLLVAIYIKDIYKYLLELELKYPIEPNHLKKQVEITGKMRATLIDWLVDVQRQFSLVLETFHLTVQIIDRYLQVVPNVPRNRLQLIGVTAMYIASKYEEIYAPEVGDFVYVTDNAYSKADVFTCEREILSKLGFCLAKPIPLSFLRRFVKAAHGTSKHHHLAKYLVDLCLVEYSMSHYRPSEMAAAALCLSLHVLSNKPLEEVWTPTLAYYSQYSLEHIDPIIRKIARIVTGVQSSRYKAVYKKYQDVTLAKVSILPHLKGEAICELVKTP